MFTTVLFPCKYANSNLYCNPVCFCHQDSYTSQLLLVTLPATNLPRWLLCTQRASCSPPCTTSTDVTLWCTCTQWNACLYALKDSQCLMKVPGDLLDLYGPCVLLETKTQAGCVWSAEEIQQGSRGTRPQMLEVTCNLARWSLVHCGAGWMGWPDLYLELFFKLQTTKKDKNSSFFCNGSVTNQMLLPVDCGAFGGKGGQSEGSVHHTAESHVFPLLLLAKECFGVCWEEKQPDCLPAWLTAKCSLLEKQIFLAGWNPLLC